MSVIKFTLLVKDAPSAKWPFSSRIERHLVVLAIDLTDAKKTYLEKCPRFEVEFLSVKDVETAGFDDLDVRHMNDDDRAHFMVSEEAAKQAFIEDMEPFPANCNPFHYDAMSMGTSLVRGWMAMHDGFDRAEEPQPLNWLYLVQTRTGRRLRIHLNESAQTKSEVSE